MNGAGLQSANYQTRADDRKPKEKFIPFEKSDLDATGGLPRSQSPLYVVTTSFLRARSETNHGDAEGPTFDSQCLNVSVVSFFEGWTSLLQLAAALRCRIAGQGVGARVRS